MQLSKAVDELRTHASLKMGSDLNNLSKVDQFASVLEM